MKLSLGVRFLLYWVIGFFIAAFLNILTSGYARVFSMLELCFIAFVASLVLVLNRVEELLERKEKASA